MRLQVILISTFLYTCASLFAQQNYILEIRSLKDVAFLKKISYNKIFSSKTEREKELQKILFICYDNAYLTASYDSIIDDSIRQKAFLNFGAQYKWAYLKKGNVDEGVLSEIGFREKLYSNKPVYFKDVKRVQEKLITYFENNGFPFASIKLDSIVISADSISAQLKLTKNEEKKIDSVVIRGTAKIAPEYIYNYLGIKPGSLYDESKLKKVNTRIAELNFVHASKPATINFTNKYNKLILNIDHKNASQFDGIVGILPNNKTGKTLFTGNVHLKLQNGLGRGELIDLSWDRLQTQTQDVILRLVYPFIFRSPFGIDYNFKLYKRDTTFLEVTQNIGVQHILSGGNYFKIFYNNKTSTLLSTKGLEFATTLPVYADVYANMYGIGLKYEKLDYRLNPRKGFSVLVNGSAGTKTIKKNRGLNPVVYDKLKLKTTQYNFDFSGSVFIPIIGRSTIKIANQSAFIYGQNIFQNELFRIGGINNLRGVNVESIFASAYSICTLEYRFILEKNSYLYVFGDGAWYENNSSNQYLHDTPYDFGTGISFETKGGIFSLNYALGKQFNNPIQFGNGKISFGLVNFF